MRATLAILLVGAIAPLAAGGPAKLPPPPAERAVVSTGRAPCGLAAHAASVWVGVYETGMLLRLDRGGRVTRRVRVGPWACRVAVSTDAVWVTRDRASVLVRLDRRTGRTRRVAVPPEPFDVLLAAGTLWVTGHDAGVVSRLDPRTGRTLDRLAIGRRPAGLAFCRGRVWVGHGGAAAWVTSIDPATLHVRRVPVGAASPGWPECIRGVLWVTTPDSLVRIDALGGELLTVLAIGETLAHTAAAQDGLVWVTDKQHSLIHRVDASGRAVLDGFPAGPGAFALARVGGSMWVTSFAGADVRRYGLG